LSILATNRRPGDIGFKPNPSPAQWPLETFTTARYYNFLPVPRGEIQRVLILHYRITEISPSVTYEAMSLVDVALGLQPTPRSLADSKLSKLGLAPQEMKYTENRPTLQCDDNALG
jgi:hypothetical protein